MQNALENSAPLFTILNKHSPESLKDDPQPTTTPEILKKSTIWLCKIFD